MKKTSFISLCLASLTALAVPEIQELTDKDGLKIVRLSNGKLSCDVLPQVSALTVDLVYTPEKRSLNSPSRYSIEKIDLLPQKVFYTANGLRELRWGAKAFHNVPFEQTGKYHDNNGVSAVWRNRYFLGENLEVTKTVKLAKDENRIETVFAVKNHNPEPYKFAFWINSIFNLGQGNRADTIFVPVKKGEYLLFGNKGAKVKEDALLIARRDLENAYYPASKNWIARKAEKQNGVLVLRLLAGKLDKNSAIYSYQLKEGVDNALRTCEIICSADMLAPGSTKNYRYECLFFPSLERVDDLCGNVGLYLNRKTGVLTLEAAADYPGGKLISGGKSIAVPPLKAGEAFSVSAPGIKSGKLENAGAFEFLPVMEEQM